MTLENLLVTDLVAHFDPENCKNFRGIKAPTERTRKVSFDLKDKEIPFIVGENEGSVTYKNFLSKEVYVTNYEEFVNSLPKNVQVGKKRCDFLVYQEDGSLFFILNELSQSRNIDAKESDALYQLQATLECLSDVASIKFKMDSCKYRLCIFSNRVKTIDSPLGMANAFNEAYMTIKQREAVPFEFEGINKLGFKYFRANLIELSDAVSLKML